MDYCILGIEPGFGGAIAFYFPSVPDKICSENMPVAAGEVDGATSSERITQMWPTIAMLERVALRLWPTSAHFSLKKDHNRTEAALLARYGTEVIVGRAA